jgi:hypothetical protein
LWLIIVSFLACFDINQAKDEFDNEIEIDHTYVVEGMVTYVGGKPQNYDHDLTLVTDIRNLFHALFSLGPNKYGS